MTRADKNLILSIPQALSQTERVCSSVNVGSTKTGIDMDAVELMGRIVTGTARPPGTMIPLAVPSWWYSVMPWRQPVHGRRLPWRDWVEAIINVGVSGPGVVKVALAKVRDANFEVLCESHQRRPRLRLPAWDQLVAQEASRHMGIPFGIIDLSLAPTPSVGDSVAEILEEIGLERVGAPEQRQLLPCSMTR